MKMIRILVCEDSLEGILSAVHEAYVSRYGLHDIRVVIGEPDPEFFTEIRYVETRLEHAASVAQAIHLKISEEALWHVRYAACAADSWKAQAIYRFLVYGFHMGASVVQCQSEPSIRHVLKLSQMVSRETQKLYGFVRFSELPGGVLFSRIRPKHRQLELLQDHFADRFPNENWMICDIGRQMACVHKRQSECQLLSYERLTQILPEQEAMLENPDAYEDLWCSFCDAVTITQRANARQQMNFMPKRFWEFLPEMQR